VIWLLLACTRDTAPVGAINLGRHPEMLVNLELPQNSRHEVGQSFPMEGWTQRRQEGEVIEWQAPLPFSHVHFGHSKRKRPWGMTLAAPQSYQANKMVTGTWEVTETHIRMRRNDGQGPPTSGVRLSYDRARDQALRLNLDISGLEPHDFTFGPVEPDDLTRRGALLPAPSTAEWRVELPRDAHIGMRVVLFKPPIRDGESDGANLVVEVDGVVKKTVELKSGDWRRVDLDLEQTGTAKVTLRTECVGDCDRDYIFVEEPTVYTPKKDPRRVVLIFADTLRPDHLGVYGYTDRPTSPAVDAFAKNAAVFTQARTVSPWTLPSARSALTGKLPDAWDPEQTLPSILAREGFFVDALVTNAFLTSRFGMGGSWSRYRYSFLESAETQVDEALKALEVWPDRDKLLMVHFMDPHVPYQEPEPWASKWAGPMPPELEGKALGKELRELPEEDHDAAAVYMKARYDQNIAYMDSQLERLFEALDEDDIVVLFSDHGEEIWDHGSFEHGHTLYDELLRVPLIVSGPGMTPGERDQPASLLDITPTVLGLLGLSAPTDGVDLRNPTAARTLGFGWTLYGPDRWGALAGTKKVVLGDGQRQVFDLAADPGEMAPTVPTTDGWMKLLEAGLGRPAFHVWRVSGWGDRKDAFASGLALLHPSGFSDAWSAYDPIGVFGEPVLDDGTVTFPRGDHSRIAREFYVVPQGELDDLTLLQREETGVRTAVGWTVGSGARLWTVTPDVTLAPVGSTTALAEEARGELQVLGYLD
jgi:hypothetical protein